MENQIVIDDVVYYDGDYILDDENTLFQLRFIIDKIWEWFALGTEITWDVNSVAGPVKPIHKVVLYKLPSEK